MTDFEQSDASKEIGLDADDNEADAWRLYEMGIINPTQARLKFEGGVALSSQVEPDSTATQSYQETTDIDEDRIVQRPVRNRSKQSSSRPLSARSKMHADVNGQAAIRKPFPYGYADKDNGSVS